MRSEFYQEMVVFEENAYYNEKNMMKEGDGYV